MISIFEEILDISDLRCIVSVQVKIAKPTISIHAI